MCNYAFTVHDKLMENDSVMKQIANNTPDQAMLGDFPKALDDAILNSGDVHREQMMQLLSDQERMNSVAQVIFDMLRGYKE